jgi:hypothetical protein
MLCIKVETGTEDFRVDDAVLHTNDKGYNILKLLRLGTLVA